MRTGWNQAMKRRIVGTNTRCVETKKWYPFVSALTRIDILFFNNMPKVCCMHDIASSFLYQ